MARGKKVKTGGKSRGTPSRQSKSPRTQLPRGSQRAGRQNESSDEYESTSFKPFSLRDAARRPQEHAGSRTSGSTYRHQTIGFVRSSGATSPKVESEEYEHDKSMDATIDFEDTTAKDDRNFSEERSSNLQQTTLQDTMTHSDTVCSTDITVSTNQGPPQVADRVIRLPPSDTLDSGDEIVVFQGRNRSAKVIAAISDHAETCYRPPQTGESDQVASALDVTSLRESLREQSPPGVSFVESVRTEPKRTLKVKMRGNAVRIDGLKKAKQARKHSKIAQDEEVLDEVIADYVANMREHGFVDDVEDYEMEATPSILKPFKSTEWTPSEIEDFNDFSTSYEVLEIVTDVLSKRTRLSGVQYLVVWDSQSIDDARWIHEAALTMQSAVDLIKIFEENEKLIPEYPQGSDDSSTDDDDIWEGTNDEASDDDDDLDSEEDERDLVERRIARMTDEQIARLLAKQEELGMGSDELLLFDDDGPESGDSSEGVDDFVAFEKSQKKRKSDKSTTPKKPKKKSHQVSVDDMLDDEDYGEFDIMDHERHSLSNGRRARGDFVSFGLSDSELELNLQTTWAADRKRKSAKKQEREELRTQGLLGKKNKFKPDLNAKHRAGISMDQIGQELEGFLFAEYETMALPPMNKKDRKMMHEVAHAFNLKSKSAGKGKARFPVLYKTSRTRPFDRDIFVRVQTQLKRRFFSRMDSNGAAKGVFAGQIRSGGFSGDISYREGDIVGGTAPELAADNRGRAMLEKMGWTTGTALGALNNKGILVPVAHVVKKSRTGLG